jgi:hypothetical protein
MIRTMLQILVSEDGYRPLQFHEAIALSNLQDGKTTYA